MSTMTVPGRRWVVAFAVLVALGVALIMGVGPGSDRSVDVAGEDAMVLAQSDDDAAAEEDESDPIALASIEVTYDVFLSRDPFESIRPPEPEPVSEDPATAPGTPTIPGTTTTPGTPTSPGTGTATNGKDPVGETGACRTGTEAVCDGTVVVLDNIVSGQVFVAVNGTSFVVEPGDRFGQNFQVLRISGNCAEFLYLNGDEAEVFSLCIGGSVAK